MKKFGVIFLLFSAFLVACSDEEEEVQPEERLEEYVALWNEENFGEMHTRVIDTPKEKFVDRYQKIYEDIEAEDLSVTFEVPEPVEGEEESEEEEESTEETFPISVSMESLAGPIEFDSEITMVKEEPETEDGEVDWKVSWSPALIFPELQDATTEIDFENTEPVRGQIFDRNRKGLAVNESIYELGVVPERFENEDAEKEEIAEAIGVSVDEIESAMSASWVQPSYFVPLKVVPGLEKDNIDDAVESITPLTYQTTTGRIYPLAEAAGHLVGYAAKINAEKLEEVDQSRYTDQDVIGYRGLEQLYEDRLKGERGIKIIAVTEENEKTTIAEKEVQNGENITLTIDIEVQQQLFNEMSGDAGTAAAINPKTGETLALVSAPAFDPNAFIYGLSNSQWQEWQEDEQNPMLNRFAATFSPGSVIKPVTSAIGLESGSIDPSEGLEINGLTWQKDGWGNYSVTRVSESSGPVDLMDALVRSDNIYFAQQALSMGEDVLVEGLKEFGFEEEFPFTYPIESSTLSNNGALDREVLLADTSYGQGEMEMSALHLAMTYTPIINQGDLMQPILEMDEESGQVWKEDILSAEHVDFLAGALSNVVTDGTARTANRESVVISGKTGTAELKQSQADESGQENGWFVGYPDDQEILISMMIEKIQDQDNGSGYVANKVANVIENLR
ncbi:penicillin-binding transpeptidase domain-containing protein [Saliterribacillus persicus]|uniref:serine-type D-Ala-D-Ala carboxypeptidase n=1 Tax=Saliterribacillus persicus TaxID=930114 RepID=A0A368Y391_9BACI|nr:penicillin-binding transpeptidase domain-containing protein [Saliterribacillus persicus]RCW74741.1 penicillin-binding protein [Saliterribacillus persicus]